MKNIIKTFNIYRSLRTGLKVDFDGYYGAQCVDLVKDWAMYIGNPIGVYGNANVLWNVGLGKNWKKIVNTRFAVPKVGDIICYDVGVYGHIAVAGRSLIGWVEILEQNGGSGNGDGLGNNAIRIRKDYYKNCVGWFTPN